MPEGCTVIPGPGPPQSSTEFFFFTKYFHISIFKAKNMEDLNDIVMFPSRLKNKFNFIAQHAIFMFQRECKSRPLCILNNKQYSIVKYIRKFQHFGEYAY